MSFSATNNTLLDALHDIHPNDTFLFDNGTVGVDEMGDDDLMTMTMNSTANATTAADGETTEVAITSWSGIWVTGMVSLVQGLVFYAFFLYQRRAEASKGNVDLYEPRQNTRKHRSPEPSVEQSWWKAALAVDDEELLRCVGLDSFMFLRFLRLGAYLCAVGTALAVVLIPVYATGNNTGNDTLQFNQLTLARVESGGGWRLWVSLVAWYAFVGIALRALYKEWILYQTNRFRFLAHGDVDMPKEYRYAVRVDQIPSEYRNDTALSKYFERLFPNKVLQATMFWETPALNDLIAERQKLIETTEQTVAKTNAKPDDPRPKVKVTEDGKVGGALSSVTGGRLVEMDAVEHYTRELERLNKAIDEERQKVLDSKTKADEDAPVETTPASLTESIKIPIKLNSKETAVTSTAHVTFTSLRSKQAAIQCELTGNPGKMVVVPAPDPKAVLWNNVGVPLPQQSVLQKQAAILFTAGILFWAVPVAFVTALANLNGILTGLGLPQADPTAAWYGLVAGLLPVVFLAILMAVLYMAIVAAATHFVRYKSMAEVDAYTLYWHQLFQFANLWLILIGGSFFDQIDTLLEDPMKIVDIIATAMPGMAVFFVNMMLVGSFGAFGMELSLLPAYGTTLVMKLLQPEAMLTQRQLDDAKAPPTIAWGQQVPKVVFIFLVILVYMPIVPIMEVFGMIYFGGYYLVFKHQCLHVYAQEFEGGGEATWQRLFPFLMACLYMGELIFVAYMGIKEAPTQSLLGFVPLVVTILFHRRLNRTIIHPLQNLSLEAAAEVDIADGELEQDKEAMSPLFGVPSLKTGEEEEREPLPYRRVEDEEAVKPAASNTSTEQPVTAPSNASMEQPVPVEEEIAKE